MPIVFSYFAEVLAREKRGEHLSWLCMFWMIGGIYASAMAWAIIPHYGEWPVTSTVHTVNENRIPPLPSLISFPFSEAASQSASDLNQSVLIFKQQDIKAHGKKSSFFNECRRVAWC